MGRPHQPAAQTTGRSVVVFGDDVHRDRAATTTAPRSPAEVTTSVVATADADDGALGGEAIASADVITFDARRGR